MDKKTGIISQRRRGRRSRRGEKKAIRAIATLIIVLIAAATGLLDPDALSGRPGVETAASLPAPDLPPDADASFRADFLDVGQGLSVLIEADGEFLLFDGGDRDASSYVVAALQERGVTQLSYLVASHYDADHLNGLVGALHTVDVQTVLGPDYTADSKVYQSFLNAVDGQGLTVTAPVPGTRYPLGDGYFDVLAPLSASYEDENDYSIVLRFACGDTSLLLTGDAQRESEEQMMEVWPDLESDILCVGHHGSPSSSSGAFLDRVAPSLAVISCGEDNPYGHPSPEVLERLSEKGIRTLRTDENGAVTILGDGHTFQVLTQREAAQQAALPALRQAAVPLPKQAALPLSGQAAALSLWDRAA